MPRTHFITPDAVLPHCAARWLARRFGARLAQTPPSLENVEILTPTKGAARAVRAALAKELARGGVAGFAGGHVRAFDALFAERLARADALTPEESYCLWTAALSQARREDCPTLFAARKPAREEFPALVETLRRLAATVAKNLLSFKDVCDTLGDGGEAARWRDAAFLESAVARAAHAMGKRTESEALAFAVAAAPFPAHAVVVGFYGLTGAQIRFLENAERAGATVDIAIFADTQDAAQFDDWGAPLPARALERDIGLDDDAVRAVASPAEEARLVGALAARWGAEASATLAISCDQTQGAAFAQALTRASGVPAALPEGVPLSQTVLHALLGEWAAAARRPRFAAVRAFLRNPYIAAFACRGTELIAEDIARAVDAVGERHPATLKDAAALSGLSADETRVLAAARELLERGKNVVDAAARVRTVCLTPPDFLATPREAAAREAACVGFDALERACARTGAAIDFSESLDVVRDALAHTAFDAALPENALLLRDWMEIFWASQPQIALCDMNDGIVPESEPHDGFLSDDTRAKLGLETRARRQARDVWMLETRLRVSRAIGGRCDVLVPRLSDDGDALKPSRLLFQTAHGRLPDRVRALFADSEKPVVRPAFSAAWTIRAATPPKTERFLSRRISVTALRDYLASPWGFYVRHVLGAAPYEADAVELDAGEYGTLLHRAWERFYDSSARDSDDPKEISAALRDGLSSEAAQLGARLRAQIRLQLRGLEQKLAAMAVPQAQWRRDGWRTVDRERRIEIPFDIEGERYIVSGRIDRIDRNEKDGRWAVVDYKTKNARESIKRAHVKDGRGNDAPRWRDLQMPLYADYLRARENAARVETAYFLAPESLADVKFDLWPDIDTYLSLAHEETCRILGQIARGEFAPQTTPDYDDFAAACGFSEGELARGRLVDFS